MLLWSQANPGSTASPVIYRLWALEAPIARVTVTGTVTDVLRTGCRM